MAEVLCLGVAVQDMVFGLESLPREARKYRAERFTEVGGGCAATAAVAIARLGGTARLAARLGDDAVADMIVSELERYGVDCTLVQRFRGHRSSLSAVLVDAAGERMIVNYRDPDLPDATDWLADSLSPDTGAVLADNRWPGGAVAVFDAARAAGVPAVLDAETPVDAASDGAIRRATHIAFSAEGLAEYAGGRPPADAVAAVARDTGGLVCVTEGARGVHWSTPEGDVAHMPAFAVDVVDTLGAGDVWHGAFALALAEGRGEVLAIRFASAAAALKCMRFGGRSGVPTRDEVDRFIQEND